MYTGYGFKFSSEYQILVGDTPPHRRLGKTTFFAVVTIFTKDTNEWHSSLIICGEKKHTKEMYYTERLEKRAIV